MEQSLSSYKIFKTVADEGSFLKAAEKLYITQPAISKAHYMPTCRAACSPGELRKCTYKARPRSPWPGKGHLPPTAYRECYTSPRYNTPYLPTIWPSTIRRHSPSPSHEEN